MEFNYRCPLCNETAEYQLPEEDACKIEPYTLIMLKCPLCFKQYAKFAYVVFGDGKRPKKNANWSD